MRLSAELEAPPRDGGDAGRSRGSPGRLGILGIWVPCGYMSGDLLLTSQVPQGIETMMRILINSAGALCAYTSVGRSSVAHGDSVVRLSFES